MPRYTVTSEDLHAPENGADWMGFIDGLHGLYMVNIRCMYIYIYSLY